MTCQQAKDIVSHCPSCQQVNSTPTLPDGVNPQGLFPNDIWQTDVTRIPTFGNAGLVHGSIDTYFGIFASHHTGQTANQWVSHFKQALLTWDSLNIKKSDNGPAYTSHTLKLFFEDWSIKHITAIPYNPQGQAIVERVHGTLKNTLQKQKGRERYGIGPNSSKDKLAIVLFTLNFLDIRGDNTEPAATIYWTNNQTANDLLSKKETLQQTQQVLWKDNKSWKREFYLNKDEVMLLF